MKPHRFERIHAADVATTTVMEAGCQPFTFTWGGVLMQAFLPGDIMERMGWESWRLGYMLTSGRGRGFA